METDILPDRMVRNATKMLQMEDPEYAAARGVSVVHFATASRDRSAEWTMLSKPSGRDSGSLPENDIYLLPELFKSRIEVRITLFLMTLREH